MYGRGYQNPGLGFGPPVTPPIVKQLLIANAIVFLVQMLLDQQRVLVGPFRVPLMTYWGGVWPTLVWEGGHLWQPFTYMWLHGGFAHIALNMFALWMFGSQLALLWGPRRFLRFYLICGVGAGFIIASWPYLIYAFTGNASDLFFPTVGASGAIYGVLLAFSLTWPDRTIMLIFPPVAFRAIWLIPGLFLLQLVFGGGQNISETGHLGGVIVGWLLLRRTGETGRLLSFKQLRYRWKRYRMRQKLRAVRYDDYARRNDDDRRVH